MRTILALMATLAACGGRPPPPQPPVALAPQPAPGDDRLARVLDRMDEVERQLERLEERLAHMEKQIADAEAPEGEELEEPEGAIGWAPAGIPAPPPPRPGQHDPATVYAVPVDGHPFEGAAAAKVTIVVAREFACPYCERVRPTLAQLLADYRGRLKIVYRNMVVHPQVATLPAQAACAAQKQGRYVDMATAIYDKGWNSPTRDLSRTKMEALAVDLGLDLRRFTADMDGPCVARLADDLKELRALGVSATPTFFINGRHLSGARPLDQYKAVIDEELVKADARIRKGTRLRDYYKTWVLKKGKPTGP